LGVLREEAIAGMDRLGAGDLGGADDGRDVQVRFLGRRRADAHRLIGELDVQRVGVGQRVHRHRLDAKLAAGADHAQRDLAAVRDQNALEHDDYPTLILKSGSPYSTAWPFSTRICTIEPSISDSISFIS